MVPTARLLPTGLLLLVGVCVRHGAGVAAAVPREGDVTPAPSSPAAALQPLNGFVENRGQWPDEVLFFGRAGTAEATLTRRAIVLRPRAGEGVDAPPAVVLWLGDVGARGCVEGEEELPTRHHFLRSAGSASGARGFEEVRYDEIAPGIDLVLRTRGDAFEYDLHVAPGAELEDFEVLVEGAAGIELEGSALVLHTAAGALRQEIAASWEEAPGGIRRPLDCRFRVLEPVGSHPRFGFEAPGRDPELPLVLDPTLVYSTYVGGTGAEQLVGMDVDAAGATYLLSRSWSGSPTTPGAYQAINLGVVDPWVGKLSPDGSTLEWATYVGTPGSEQPTAIDVDTDGSVVIAGYTWSHEFPTTPGSYQPEHGGGTGVDTFVTRIAPDGTSLVASTYFGGPGDDQASAMAIAPDGGIVVALRSGFDWSTLSPPATPGAFDSQHDTGEFFVAKLTSDLSQLDFSTYVVVGSPDALAFDSVGNIVLAGIGTTTTLTTPGAFQEVFGGDLQDAFAAKLSVNGSELLWCTLLGGYRRDWAVEVDLDAADAVYVAGTTQSLDFPVTEGSFATTINGTADAFITKILPGGSGLVWSTFIGGCCGGVDSGRGVVVDAAGNAYLLGSANQPGWPTTPDAHQSSYQGPFPSGQAAFTKFGAAGYSIVYSTWFGGTSSSSQGLQVAHHDGDGIHLGYLGYAGSPTSHGAYQTTYKGNGDLVAAKFSIPNLPWSVLGSGLAGTKDTPNLVGEGSLAPGSTTRLCLRGAHPSSVGWLIAGLSHLDLPLLGGTLVPTPQAIVPLSTQPDGGADFTFPWPPLPSGSAVGFQAWILDPGAPAGWSASNAIEAHVP